MDLYSSGQILSVHNSVKLDFGFNTFQHGVTEISCLQEWDGQTSWDCLLLGSMHTYFQPKVNLCANSTASLHKILVKAPARGEASLKILTKFPNCKIFRFLEDLCVLVYLNIREE